MAGTRRWAHRPGYPTPLVHVLVHGTTEFDHRWTRRVRPNACTTGSHPRTISPNGRCRSGRRAKGVRPINECEFCDKFQDPPTNRAWYDYHVLGRGTYWHVLLPIGPLTPGHVMVVSNSHYSSCSQAPPPARNELRLLTPRLSAALEQLWPGATLTFEHSSRKGGTVGCIEHAHLQIAPGLGEWAAEVFTQDFRVVSSPDDIVAQFPTGGYVMTSAGGVTRVAPDERVPSQFFRRRLCHLQGREDEWDYLTHRQEPDMTVTLQAAMKSDLLATAVDICSGRRAE